MPDSLELKVTVPEPVRDCDGEAVTDGDCVLEELWVDDIDCVSESVPDALGLEVAEPEAVRDCEGEALTDGVAEHTVLRPTTSRPG